MPGAPAALVIRYHCESQGRRVSKSLETMDRDFEMKRRLIEELDVNITLVVENKDKVIYARCWLGEEVFLTRGTLQGIVRPP
jgi:hypothetical protein